MSYKWTLKEIDSLTWPQLFGLMKEMKQVPPPDLFLHSVFKIKTSETKANEVPGSDIKRQLSRFKTKKGKVGQIRRK